MPSRTCSFGCIVSSEEKCFVVRLDLMLQRAKSFSSERNALCAARLQKTQRRAIRVNTESQAFQIVPVVSRARLKHTFDPLLARICKHKTARVHRFRANVRLLSSWHGPQAALKCSYGSVTRDWPVVLREDASTERDAIA